MWKVKITRKQELRCFPASIWISPIQAQFTLHCVSRKINVSCMVSRRALSHGTKRYIVCLECNDATPTFSKIVLLFYSIATNRCMNCANVLLFRVKTKKLQLFYYLGHCFIIWEPLHVLKCAKVLLAIEPLHSQCLSYFVVTCEIHKGCIGDRTIAFLIFAIGPTLCAEIIPKESLSF